VFESIEIHPKWIEKEELPMKQQQHHNVERMLGDRELLF
jgi:hypothetical protein